MKSAETRPLSVLTPYLFQRGSNKVVNVGDGMILRAVERRLGSFQPALTLTSRAAPTPEQEQTLLDSAATILAGANQLDDHFTPWPGMTADALRHSSHIFVPMGVGIHGDQHRNKLMADNTRQVLAIIHERVSYSSWRCPMTAAYLLREMPELGSKVLMTGCPVLYDKPLLESSIFTENRDVIAVTATERDDFWTRETLTIDFVARSFPSSRKVLAVHQDYLARKKPVIADHLLGAAGKSAHGLRRYAKAHGFDVITPATQEEAIAFYRTAGMHFGSRLHAHLHMLSQNKPSFLTKVDERSTGIAEHFGFPLCDAARFADYMDFDFEAVRQAALRTFPVMQKFVESIGR